MAMNGYQVPTRRRMDQSAHALACRIPAITLVAGIVIEFFDARLSTNSLFLKSEPPLSRCKTVRLVRVVPATLTDVAWHRPRFPPTWASSRPCRSRSATCWTDFRRCGSISPSRSR